MAFAADFPQVDRNEGSPRVLVVIPTYNEIDNIVPILDRLRDANPSADMLVVDDGSPDGTAERDRKDKKRKTSKHQKERTEKNGLGAAYRAGFAWGLEQDYDVLVEMDADGSHQPEQLPSLLERIAGGADLVLGSRWVPGAPC